MASQSGAETMADRIEQIYRDDSRRVLATLIRLLGDFDLAEEAMQEAFAAALARWPAEGVPDNPRAWLVSTGRFKAIDQLRRRARHDAHLTELALQLETSTSPIDPTAAEAIGDDRLRLIFTCCHPALGIEAQLALTLREVCGLATEEVARAFLCRPTTIAQRIVRAKTKIRDARIPYEVPGPRELPARLDAVLQVIYLLFNEAYAASAGEAMIRHDLAQEAIRLGRLLAELLPASEASGLLALMLLQDSRRAARVTAAGDLVLLADQDRSLWDRDQIREGTQLAAAALASGAPGSYTLQAAIAATHASAAAAGSTDWVRIVALYDALAAVTPTPVVELNRAVAVAMRDGPAAGLTIIDQLLAAGDLAGYHLAHAARADLTRKLGRTGEARAAYERALDLARLEPERRFLAARLAELGA